MTREETKAALQYIGDYYALSDSALSLAEASFYAVLKSYTPKEVKAAIDAYTSQDTRGFVPKPGQIKALIPKKERQTSDEFAKLVIDFMAKSQRMREKYHRYGLRSAGEALRDGVKYSDWVRECEERMEARRAAKEQ